jgi:Carboxypeptidase regulatory-like domain/TonB dependent receptor/TonB-dependent Receptor Plug Domain
MIAALWMLALSVLLPLLASPAWASHAAESATATLAGRVVDESGGVVAAVEVVIVDPATGLERSTQTSAGGEFVFPGLPPARYQLTAQRDGFGPLQVSDVILHVNDETVLHLTLKVSPIGEAVFVEANTVRVTSSAAVSTVIDRQLVEHLPTNARSLQALIWLVPGMIRTSDSGYGQFSANGQRDNANYVTIDGASANISAGHTLSAAGGLPAATRLGTTSNLISLDAMEDVRVQTSSYAAEYGRTPGAQIAIRSRSGTNQLHGAAFEYFRHDALDANDWFANSADVEQADLRHHQFGGAAGGPIVKNRAFFFGAYEGLRVRQPVTLVSVVPSLRAREIAAPALQPLLRAFPLPTTDREDGLQGEHIGSMWIPARLDAVSGRFDYLHGPRFTVFGRYNQAPSTITTAEPWNAAMLKQHIDRTRTITGGVHMALSTRLHNELRVNYSSNARAEWAYVGSYGGAAPLRREDVLSRPDSFFWGLFFNSAAVMHVADERGALARQINIADNLTAVLGGHQIKLGVDIRQMALRLYGNDYNQALHFDTEADLVSGIAPIAFLAADTPRAPRIRNYSAYVQDTWHAAPGLTLTYGVRWDANPAPFDAYGQRPYVLRGFENPATARVAPLAENEPLYRTRWWNFAPRVGASYLLAERRPGWGTVLRGGAGVFYDVGNASTLWVFEKNPPFVSSVLRYNVPYPLSPADAAPLPLTPAADTPISIAAVDPNLRSPYTWQWNAAIAQSLGPHQTLTVTYVGAAGRRLLQREYFQSLPAVPQVVGGSVIASDGRSAYRALQMQFERRMSNGLQALASYSWAHAQDEQSDDLNRFDTADLWGDADFDIRHSAAAGLTYDLPAPRQPALARLFGQWGIDATIRASSAYPFTPRAATVVLSDGTLTAVLPDLVAGAPMWLDDPAAAGGRRLNPEAFTMPPAGRQGNAGRNRLRGFAFSQLDLALRRAFRLRDSLRLGFRIEAFNVLNHPNFLNPATGDRLGTLNFGRATQMANRGFAGLQGPALQPFYESGGPRSMQVSLRLEF